MKSQGVARHVLTVGAAAAMLVGCANGTRDAVSQETMTRGAMPRASSVPARPRGPKRAGWLSPAAKVPGQQFIYVSEEYTDEVVIYPEKGSLQSPIGTITAGVSGPWGLYVDKYRTLYVTNQGNNTVTAYPAGASTPGLEYSKELSRPLYTIVDRYGNVFVGNANNGTVVEYIGGFRTQYKVIQTAGNEVDGMDFDQQGNLYVAYRSGSGGSIEEFAPDSSNGTILGMTLDQPQGLIVDSSGNILVVESGSGRIDVFPPGQQTPSLEVPIPNSPNQLAIRQSEASVVVAAEGGTVYGIRYPFTRHPRVHVKDVPNAIIQGVAFSNDQHF